VAEGDGAERPHVERQPDFGNVIHVNCRKCGSSNLLDPTRMFASGAGRVTLICTTCYRAFRVRRRDIGRPALDASIAALYSTGPTETSSRWSRLSRRS